MKALCIILLGLWVVFASGFLTRFWMSNPDKFPDFPEPLAIWLVTSSGLPKGDVAILFGLGVSFVIVTLCTTAGWLGWRYLQNTLKSRSSGRS